MFDLFILVSKVKKCNQILMSILIDQGSMVAMLMCGGMLGMSRGYKWICKLWPS